MLVDRIKNNSTSLVQDLEMMNRKLANNPWLKNRVDICKMLLTMLTVLEKKEVLGIHVRELKARLGEREILTSPGVRVLSQDGGGMRGVATLRMLEEFEKRIGAKTRCLTYSLDQFQYWSYIGSLVGINCMGAREGWKSTWRWEEDIQEEYI